METNNATPTSEPVNPNAEDRAAYIAGLRAAALFYENNPAVAIPSSMSRDLSHYGLHSHDDFVQQIGLIMPCNVIEHGDTQLHAVKEMGGGVTIKFVHTKRQSPVVEHNAVHDEEVEF